MKIKAISQWFGNNRTLAPIVGEKLGRLKWCGVPFMGGAAELPFLNLPYHKGRGFHRHCILYAAKGGKD